MNPRTIGLLLFLAVLLGEETLFLGRLISLFVVVNGILCHEKGYVLWDVACNFFFCTYVNMTTSLQPLTLLLTILSLFFFLVSNRMESPLLHVLLVQLPLAYCISLYELRTGEEA